MKIIESVRYYTAAEVGMLIGRSAQMIKLWDCWSDEREAEGKDRFIPRSTKLGKRGDKYWSEYEVQILQEFAVRKPMGLMKEYSRRKWSYKYMPQEKEETFEEIVDRLVEENKDVIKLAESMIEED